MIWTKSIFFVGLICAIPATVPAQQPAGDTVALQINDIVLVVQDCVMQNGQAATNLPKGAKLRIIELNGEWVGCSVLLDGREQKGWVNRRLVTRVPQAGSIKLGDTVVIRENTTLKLGQQILGEVPRGTRLQVTRIAGDWVGVTGVVGGREQEGWVERQVVQTVFDNREQPKLSKQPSIAEPVRSTINASQTGRNRGTGSEPSMPPARGEVRQENTHVFCGEIHQSIQWGMGHELERVKAMVKANPDLVFSKDEHGLTPLHFAAMLGHIDVAKFLVASKADVNAKDNDGVTPLHFAVLNRHKAVVEFLVANNAVASNVYDAAAVGDLEKLKSLTQVNPGLVYSIDKHKNETPLHSATAFGRTVAVKLLLDNGANVNARRNGDRDTPLHLAALEGFKDVVELLLAKGADINAKTLSGFTPLHLTADRGVAELLLAKGADVNAKSFTQVGLATTELDKFPSYTEGFTPLHWAAYQGRKAVAELLLANKADLNAKDRGDWTPLHYAMLKDHEDLAELLLAKLVELKAGHPLEALPDWDCRKKLGKVLEKLGWKPISDKEQVYIWICKADSASVKAHWEQTSGVLLADVRSGNRRKIENSVYSLVSIGKAEIIPELVRIIDAEGNIEMAETFLNCGRDELDKVARSWANRHGYRISTGRGANKAGWGRW